jgi:hypothetical protein
MVWSQEDFSRELRRQLIEIESLRKRVGDNGSAHASIDRLEEAQLYVLRKLDEHFRSRAEDEERRRGEGSPAKPLAGTSNTSSIDPSNELRPAAKKGKAHPSSSKETARPVGGGQALGDGHGNIGPKDSSSSADSAPGALSPARLLESLLFDFLSFLEAALAEKLGGAEFDENGNEIGARRLDAEDFDELDLDALEFASEDSASEDNASGDSAAEDFDTQEIDDEDFDFDAAISEKLEILLGPLLEKGLPFGKASQGPVPQGVLIGLEQVPLLGADPSSPSDPSATPFAAIPFAIASMAFLEKLLSAMSSKNPAPIHATVVIVGVGGKKPRRIPDAGPPIPPYSLN